MTVSEEPHSIIPELASHRRCMERIQNAWPGFLSKRTERLEQQRRFGEACEKVAENILEDLFTSVLDWPLTDFNNQVDHADIVLTDHGIKRLVVEVKRPDTLQRNRKALESALGQARRYASEQKISTVAVSDSCILYAANIANGGLMDRVYVSLCDREAQVDLWWLSVHGVGRDPQPCDRTKLRALPEEAFAPSLETIGAWDTALLLHPKYKLPLQCFAYVGDCSKPGSWKLPYLMAAGDVDAKRLPKAVQSILSNYRGAKVSGIPEKSIAAVLTRLARAAWQTGHLPPHTTCPAPIYRQLLEALDQLDVPRAAFMDGHAETRSARSAPSA